VAADDVKYAARTGSLNSINQDKLKLNSFVYREHLNLPHEIVMMMTMMIMIVGETSSYT